MSNNGMPVLPSFYIGKNKVPVYIFYCSEMKSSITIEDGNIFYIHLNFYIEPYDSFICKDYDIEQYRNRLKEIIKLENFFSKEFELQVKYVNCKGNINIIRNIESLENIINNI